MKKLVLVFCVVMAVAGGAVSAQDGEYERSEDCIRKNGAVFYYDRGYGFYNSADYEAALLDFNCAAYLDDSNLDAMHMRGLMFELLERPQEAYDAFEQVVQADPEYSISYIGLGNAALDLNQNDEAVEYFSTYLEFDPQNATILYNRAIAYYRIGEYQTAVEDYSEAIELDPEYANAYGGRADAYNALEEYEMAIDDLMTAFDLEMDGVSWMFPILAEAYVGLGQFDEAREAYERYLEFVPEPDPETLAAINALNGCQVTARENVNRRVNAGLNYAVLGVLPGGESAFANAKRTDDEGNTWWRLVENAGWVRSDTVTENEACDIVADVTP
jgi:tetratricopeptide (TPR) repeat protein